MTDYIMCENGKLKPFKIEPNVDLVEVVRCKDCKHCSIDYYPDGNEPTYACLLEDMGTNKDFYCANGERVSEDA